MDLSRIMSGGKHCGKKRVHNCECTYNFTCRFCLVVGLLTDGPLDALQKEQQNGKVLVVESNQAGMV